MPTTENMEMEPEVAVVSSPFQAWLLRCRLFLIEHWKKFAISAVIIISLVVIIFIMAPNFEQNNENRKVYHFNMSLHYNGVAYRIYVPAFQGANGNGRGSILGIKNKLPYFKQLNISLLWISSLQKTYENDDDITNFANTDLNLAYHDDVSDWLAEFLKEAKKHGIKVIMDITINHSSFHHNWFISSISNDSKYKNYYIWHEGRMNKNQREPPNNWVTADKKSAWTWNEKRQAYYFHRLGKNKPDLNWENKDVLDDMKLVFEYWLDKGIDGFYIEHFPYLLERSSWINDRELLKDVGDNMDVLEKLQKMIRNWKLRKNETEEKLLLFYSRERRTSVKKVEGISVGLVNDVLYTELKKDFQSYIIEETYELVEKKHAFPVWVLGNDVRSRIATKFGPEASAILQQVQLLLPGLSVIYYGEEIGMTDLPSTISRCTINFEQRGSKLKEKDRFRTPMQWNEGHLAGFSNASYACPPLNENFKKINVKVQMENSKSLWNRIKHFISLKTHFGTTPEEEIYFPLTVNDPQLFAFIRKGRKVPLAYLLIVNTGENPRNLTLNNFKNRLENVTEFELLPHYGSHHSGVPVDMESGVIVPHRNVTILTFPSSMSPIGNCSESFEQC